MRPLLILFLLIPCSCEQNRLDTADSGYVYDAEEEDEVVYALPPKELPEGFPLDLMNRATVEHSAVQQPSDDDARVFQVNLSVEARPDRVADFYEEQLKSQGLSVQREEVRIDRTQQVMLLGEGRRAEATALIARNHHDQRSTVTITWTSKPSGGAVHP